MRITLRRPFGRYEPGDVVDVDERMADVLVREKFARRAGEAAPEPATPKPPTLVEVRAYVTKHGGSTRAAVIALTKETPPCT